MLENHSVGGKERFKKRFISWNEKLLISIIETRKLKLATHLTGSRHFFRFQEQKNHLSLQFN